MGMDVEHIKLDDAELPDLRWFAEVILQLEIDPKANGNHVRSAIKKAGWPEDKPIYANRKAAHIPTNCDESGTGRPTPQMAEFNGKARKCLRINIPAQEQKGGDEPVPVSVNGVAMFIPRGKPFWVPVEYVEVLEHAERFVYPEYDGNGPGGLTAPQIVKEYPFNYVM